MKYFHKGDLVRLTLKEGVDTRYWPDYLLEEFEKNNWEYVVDSHNDIDLNVLSNHVSSNNGVWNLTPSYYDIVLVDLLPEEMFKI